MPHYKLSYFEIKALAEPIRFLLSYLEEDFEDFRCKREDWPNLKPSMPWGKMPVLEVDGKKVNQSTAISRYLGRKAKLAGNDDWEGLQIDAAVDTLHDLRQACASYWYEPEGPEKTKKRELAQKETIPYYLGKFDELVKENNGYLANGKLSWGDLYFIGLSDYLSAVIGYDVFEKYPNLKKLKENVVSIPTIKKWIANRPESEF